MSRPSKGSPRSIHINFTRGQTVILGVKDPPQTLRGIFHRHDTMRSTIVLKQITTVPSDGRVIEQYELELNDIKDITSVQPAGESPSHCTTDSKQSILAPKKVPSPEELDNNIKVDLESEGTLLSVSLTNKMLENIEQCVEQYIFIKQLDATFTNAMHHLREHRIIAISGEGSFQGRNGLIGVLGLAVSKTVYLIDLITLGERAFTANGKILKDMFESKDILKVVHDCRLLSDCLWHKYKVKLCNVYDTQVMHAVITKYRTCSYPVAAATLSDLLTEYLSFPSDMIETERSDIVKWRQRPIEESLVKIAAWRVSALHPLRQTLENALYAPFDKFCALYVNVVRNCDSIEAQMLMHKNSVYPQEMTRDKNH